jgi:peptide/nickel transport system substrate-binding protein
MDGPSGRYLKDAEMSQALAQGWQDIGLKVNLKVLEWSLYAGTLIPSGDLDPLFFLGLGSPFSGQQEIFYVHPDYSLNFTRWKNDDFVAKYATLGQTIDPDQRQQLMDELQQIIYDDCPWVPIWHQVDFYGATKDMGWEARADENIFALDVAGAN